MGVRIFPVPSSTGLGIPGATGKAILLSSIPPTTNLRVSYRRRAIKLHVTERFTRMDPESLKYEITNDPGSWIKPWSTMIPLKRNLGSDL